jgi:hypothetical protein
MTHKDGLGKITIQEYAFHRNGVFGEPFWAVRFQWNPGDGKGKEDFLASLFYEKGYCSILSVDRLESHGVAFGRGNSWRGDEFEPRLRKLIEKAEKAKGREFSPFAV